MTIKQSSYLFIAIAVAVTLFSFVRVLGRLGREQQPPTRNAVQVIQARRPQTQNSGATTVPTTTQVVVGTPEFYDKPVSTRYTYRNERNDPNQLRSLYLIDRETGEERRLGDDNHASIFGTMNDEYLLWFYWGEKIDLHLYTLATGEDRFLYTAGSTLTPQIAGDWITFGRLNRAGEYPDYTLFAANIATNEVLTLTRRLGTQGNAYIDAYFGISEKLAAWFEPPETIIVYDLQTGREVTRLVDPIRVFNEPFVPILNLTPGETVITWGQSYGYDLVTQSYFRIMRVRPPGAEDLLIADMGRAREENRMLHWELRLTDNTQRHVRAPLLDATPSTAPCIDGQNLVQNGDLESTTDHALWQQSGSPTNLLVNDPPPGLAAGGQWAIRLGRFNNARQAIHQTVAIPSGVNALTLTFAVRVYSWDLWGGDRLQLDLVDPMTGNSLLATPVE